MLLDHRFRHFRMKDVTSYPRFLKTLKWWVNWKKVKHQYLSVGKAMEHPHQNCLRDEGVAIIKPDSLQYRICLAQQKLESGLLKLRCRCQKNRFSKGLSDMQAILGSVNSPLKFLSSGFSIMVSKMSCENGSIVNSCAVFRIKT